MDIEIGTKLKLKTSIGHKECFIYDKTCDDEFTYLSGYLTKTADFVSIVYDKERGYRGEISWSSQTQRRYGLKYTLSFIEDIECI
ncbi:hypothetical protein SJ_199 [Proteus phage SJ_PmiM]|nr:hypothetical protein SJ_199 [Proteus phage SJ_PmiM]